MKHHKRQDHSGNSNFSLCMLLNKYYHCVLVCGFKSIKIKDVYMHSHEELYKAGANRDYLKTILGFQIKPKLP